MFRYGMTTKLWTAEFEQKFGFFYLHPVFTFHHSRHSGLIKAADFAYLVEFRILLKAETCTGVIRIVMEEVFSYVLH